MKNRIFFQKPNLELFDSMGLSSVDMHFHSRYSDSYTRVQTILKKCRKKKLGISITDHNAIEGSMKASENAQGVMVVPGIEVTCNEGPHLCFYFYSKGELADFYAKHIRPYMGQNPYMAINRSVQEVIDNSKDFNCVRVAPHPYGYSVTNCGLSKCVKKNYVEESVLDSIDGMEVINGSMGRHLNRKAHSKALEMGKGFTGGTDGHVIFELGKTVTCSYADDLDSFLGSIVKKKNYVIGRETKILPKTNHGLSVVARHMRYAAPSLLIQYQINKARVTSVPGKIVSGIRNLTNGKR